VCVFGFAILVLIGATVLISLGGSKLSVWHTLARAHKLTGRRTHKQ
jgi:hypothetical protein